MTPADGTFPITRWTLISRLKSPDATAASRALDELCAQYRYPLYCYIRRRGFSHHDAEDALQDFFARLLRLETFLAADVEKGRLRSLLATALQRFLANWVRDRPHRSREECVDPTPGGGQDDEGRYQREHFTDNDTPESVFNRKWGHELIASALGRLSEKYTASGKSALFQALRPVLVAGGSLRGQDSAAIAADLNISAGALRVALSRLLRDYRDEVHQEVLATVGSPGEVDDEIAFLLNSVRTR